MNPNPTDLPSLADILAELTRNAGHNNQENGSLFKMHKGARTDEQLRQEAQAQIIKAIESALGLDALTLKQFERLQAFLKGGQM